ncbi:MAG: hypothetical protein KDD02_16030 [Phaeodactylibacter sp.]|nr:hypothetical protein [Phaeodactylibacter sp.]MCB9300585.1 hypothetical protein [Lewinellaceae bacterium]HQU58644.1 hypothetical protein [Saprospiraceae bacterium]
MTKRSMKHRLIRARVILNQIVEKILDINKNRKRLPYHRNPSDAEQSLNEELRLLNKMAKQQAMLIQHYEAVLDGQDHRFNQLRR